MADVKKIDIDGVQWDVKDQEARTNLATLETKTTVTEKILAQRGTSYVSLVTINNKKFVHFRFRGDIIISKIGQNILNVGVIEGLMETISVIADLTRVDRGGRYPAVVDLTANGEVKVYPIMPNQIDGGINNCVLYGDCFTMIS